MTEEIRKAVIQAIAKAYGLPVYGQNVPQGGRKPSFTVELIGMEQKRLLGRRSVRKVTFEVNYYCGEEKTAAAEGIAVMDELYETLLIIGEDEKFAAGGMKHEKTADGARFTVEYEYHILFDEEENGQMERMKYNGEEAVGYEEETDIQQGTTE